jgi:hypothetical protein
MKNSTVLCFASVLSLSTPALAQNVYWGGGLAFGSGTSDQVTGGVGSSDLSAAMVTLILGQRFDRGSMFYGWEASADLSFGADTENSVTGVPCATVASGSYLCSHDMTLRIVGVLGTSVGQGTDVFGSLGVGILKGDFADNSFSVESASVQGVTAGVGVNHAFGNGLIGRGEVIYDKFNHSSQAFYSSEYTGTTVRLSVLRKF